MKIEPGVENPEFKCAYEFGVTALEFGKFGFHTTTVKLCLW